MTLKTVHLMDALSKYPWNWCSFISAFTPSLFHITKRNVSLFLCLPQLHICNRDKTIRALSLSYHVFFTCLHAENWHLSRLQSEACKSWPIVTMKQHTSVYGSDPLTQTCMSVRTKFTCAHDSGMRQELCKQFCTHPHYCSISANL